MARMESAPPILESEPGQQLLTKLSQGGPDSPSRLKTQLALFLYSEEILDVDDFLNALATRQASQHASSEWKTDPNEVRLGHALRSAVKSNATEAVLLALEQSGNEGLLRKILNFVLDAENDSLVRHLAGERYPLEAKAAEGAITTDSVESSVGAGDQQDIGAEISTSSEKRHKQRWRNRQKASGHGNFEAIANTGPVLVPGTGFTITSANAAELTSSNFTAPPEDSIQQWFSLAQSKQTRRIEKITVHKNTLVISFAKFGVGIYDARTLALTQLLTDRRLHEVACLAYREGILVTSVASSSIVSFWDVTKDGGGSRLLQQWDMARTVGKKQQTGCTFNIQELDWSSDNLAVLCFGGSAAVFRYDTTASQFQSLKVWQGCDSCAKSIFCCGDRVYVADMFNIFAWNLMDATLVYARFRDFSWGLGGASRDVISWGNEISSVKSNGGTVLQLWNTETGKILRKVRVSKRGFTHFQAKGNAIFTVDEEYVVSLWRLDDFLQLNETLTDGGKNLQVDVQYYGGTPWDKPPPQKLTGIKDSVKLIKFIGNSLLIATHKNEVFLWNNTVATECATQSILKSSKSPHEFGELQHAEKAATEMVCRELQYWAEPKERAGDPVTAVHVIGDKVVVYYTFGIARLYNISSLQVERTIDTKSHMKSVVHDTDDSTETQHYFIALHKDKFLRKWDLRTGVCLAVTNACWSKVFRMSWKGALLFAAHWNPHGRIVIESWVVTEESSITHRSKWSLLNPQQDVPQDICYDGRFVMLALHGEIRLLDPNGGGVKLVISRDESYGAATLYDSVVAVSTFDRHLEIWDTRGSTGESSSAPLRVLQDSLDSAIVAFATFDNYIVVGYMNGFVGLLDRAKVMDPTVQSLNDCCKMTLRLADDGVRSLAFCPQSNTLVCATTQYGEKGLGQRVFVWSAASNVPT